MPIPVTLKDIEQARRRIASGICLSPCPESPSLSKIIGANIFCKLDNLQHTGSFKERGARNALLLLPADAAMTPRSRFSGGNSKRALRAPRSLKLPVCCRLSSLQKMFAPMNFEREGDSGQGERQMPLAIRRRACSMSLNVTGMGIIMT